MSNSQVTAMRLSENNEKSKTTFVTGGSGFIGSRIIKSSPSNIRALVYRKEVESENIDRVHGDFLS